MYAVCVEKTYLMCKALLKAIRECMHGCEALILHAFITILLIRLCAQKLCDEINFCLFDTFLGRQIIALDATARARALLRLTSTSLTTTSLIRFH